MFFGTSFLNVVGAYIKKKSISTKWGYEMIKFPFYSILSKPYKEEDQDNEEQKLDQLAEIHLQTLENEVERVLVRHESLFEEEEK